MDNKVRKQIDQSLIILIARIVFSLVVTGGLLHLANQLLKHGLVESGRDVFNVLIGGVITVFILNGKYWFERSADYSESKNVERVNKLSGTNEEQDSAPLYNEAKAVESSVVRNVIEEQQKFIDKLLKEIEELKAAQQKQQDAPNTTPQP